MDMRKYLPETNEEKLRFILEVKDAYNAGELTLDEARAKLRARVDKISPWEIAIAEQTIKEFEDDECRKEDIQAMLDLYDGLMDTSRPPLPEDHPISCYYRENEEMKKVLLAIEDLVQYPVIKNQWYEIYDKLAEYRKHFSRKQNQLYSTLEKKGFDRPTTTMWTLDDFIRDEIANARVLLDEGKEDEFIEMQPIIVADVRDLMQKEETVLYPTSMAMISPEEFEDMKSGDHEIGFALIDVDKKADAPKAAPAQDAGFAAELAALLSKHGLAVDPKAPLPVKTGEMTLEQINLVYQHLPVDVTYVDENEIVKFYSDTTHRVFPRSKNVIGRDVKNCHPRSSVHIVEEIVQKFRSGEQDHAEFWINKPGLFIYIYYAAVRDAEGNFRGIIEMMQDCTHIRSLEGSQTLLTWEKKEESAEEAAAEAAEAVAEAEAPQAPVEGDLELNADTRLQDLLAKYPWLKAELPKVDQKFKMLQTPLARIMIPKATISVMAERTGRSVDEIIAGVKGLIESHR